MTRMARSQTNFVAPNQGLAKVSTQFTNQAVPQIQSDSQGLDPFRGDMTNAFNNFFGSINNSLGSIVEVQRNEEKRVATEYANDMKARAATEAQDYYVNNPQQRDVNTALETEDTDLQSNRHFVNTYKQTLGSNIGSRLYADFTASQASANPANFESAAQAFWEENYSEGTGDPQVDLAMQTAWTRNYENNRISAAQETIRRARAAAALENRRSIFRALRDDVSLEGLNEIMGQGPNNGGLSRGQQSAQNFGIIMQYAQNGDLSFEEINVVEAWINHVPTGPDGETGQSIAQKFPIMATNAEQQLPIIAARNATLEGERALTDITNRFTEGLAQYDDPVDQFNYITQNSQPMIEELRNTPGVSGRAIASFRSDLNSRTSGMLEYVGARTAMTTIGVGDPPPFAFDPNDSVSQRAMVDAVASAESPTEAGNILANVVGLYGPEVVATPIKQILNAQLVSPDIETRMKAATIVMQASGVSGSFDENIQNALIDPDAQLRMNFIRDTMDQGENLANAVAMAGRIDAAMAIIDDEGGVEFTYLFGEQGNSAEKAAAMNDFFIGENMLDRLERVVEGRSLVGATFSIQRYEGISAEAQQAMRRSGDAFIIKQRALGQSRPTPEEIRNHVAETMVDKMFLENGVWKYDETVQPSADESQVRVGVSVYNPATGERENVVETLELDVSTLEDSFYALNFPGDFTTEYVGNSDGGNDRMILNDGLPIDLAVGSTIEVDAQYDANGQRLGTLSGSFNGSSTVTLTGDPETDAQLLLPAIGAGVTLQPFYSGDNVVSYSLMASPRFTGGGTVDVEGLAGEDRTMPIDSVFIDPATGYARPAQQNPMDVIPDEYWQTQEGIDLKQAIDANDPYVGQYVDGVARRFEGDSAPVIASEETPVPASEETPEFYEALAQRPGLRMGQPVNISRVEDGILDNTLRIAEQLPESMSNLSNDVKADIVEIATSLVSETSEVSDEVVGKLASVFEGFSETMGQVGFSEYTNFIGNFTNPGGTITESNFSDAELNVMSELVSAARANNKRIVDYTPQTATGEGERESFDEIGFFRGIGDPSIRLQRTIGTFDFYKNDEQETIVYQSYHLDGRQPRNESRSTFYRAYRNNDYRTMADVALNLRSQPIYFASVLGYVRQQELQAAGKPYHTDYRVNLGVID